jgi:hypothetical protein
MKKTIIVMIFVCTAMTSMFSQPRSKWNTPNFEGGIFGGLNLPKLTGGGDNASDSDWPSRLGPAFGITGTYRMTENWFLRADALYSSEGGIRDGMQAIDGSTLDPSIPAGTFFYADYKNESVLNYFEIPVLLKYKLPLNRSSAFYADLGPYAGILLNAKQKTSGSSIVYADKEGTIPVSVDQSTGNPVEIPLDSDTNITDKIKKFNFGVTGGIGFSHKIGIGDLSLDIRVAYGLTAVQKEEQSGTSHTGNLLVALGYSIPF